jgi:predicted nucleotidyltransferase
MRLTDHQRDAIVKTFLEVFGKGEIRLFGSRVDDAQRGGDIDLYVTPEHREHLAEARITFLARLKRRIGEQRIDLVLAADKPRPIDVLARECGVVLCRKH